MKQRAAVFVEENLKTIFAYALSRVSDKEDAEDLTNDIVLAILQSADKIRDEHAFYGYVWGIAANTYRKFLRKRERHAHTEIADTVSDPYDFTEDVIASDEARTLRREIALLSKEYRECTVAYYFDSLSCAEIAKKHGISLEMVKYYLFKTRKILKEGISMEREFGERSFKPTFFQLGIIFSGAFNREYQNLFSRKLPGQILSSAYYTPMSIRELAIELGVASVYLEDEVAMLEKYNLICKTNGGKYLTNILIFTDECIAEFRKKAMTFTVPHLGHILQSVKRKMAAIRALSDSAAALTDEQILWSVLWAIMRQGHMMYRDAYPHLPDNVVLCNNTMGTVSGVTYDEYSGDYGCYSFAGYMGINKTYEASAADFGVLPLKNRFIETLDREQLVQQLDRARAGEDTPPCVMLTVSEEETLYALLKKECEEMIDLYEQLYRCACAVLADHAPTQLRDEAPSVMYRELFYKTVGLLGYAAVQSGELTVPDTEAPLGVYIRVTE